MEAQLSFVFWHCCSQVSCSYTLPHSNAIELGSLYHIVATYVNMRGTSDFASTFMTSLLVEACQLDSVLGKFKKDRCKVSTDLSGNTTQTIHSSTNLQDQIIIQITHSTGPEAWHGIQNNLSRFMYNAAQGLPFWDKFLTSKSSYEEMIRYGSTRTAFGNVVIGAVRSQLFCDRTACACPIITKTPWYPVNMRGT